MKLELNKIHNGDCLELMKLIPDNSVDAIITDPPYGTTACKWDSVIPLEPMWGQLKRIIKPKGAIVLFGSQPFTTTLISSNHSMFKYQLIWEKSKSGSAFTAKYRPIAKHEEILVFCKGTTNYYPQMEEGTPYTRTRKPPPINNHKLGLGKKENTTINEGTRYPSSVLRFQQKWRRQDQLHPTQKPVALLEYLIKTYTQENEVVLDFTIGSGTTAVAAINTNRQFIGIEKDKGYYDIACRRIEEAVMKKGNVNES